MHKGTEMSNNLHNSPAFTSSDLRDVNEVESISQHFNTTQLTKVADLIVY